MMTFTPTRDLKVTFTQYLESLRVYAKRVIFRGDALTDAEELDKKTRMDLLLAIGRSFKLTNKEMVALIFEGALREPRRCGCPTCRILNKSNRV